MILNRVTLTGADDSVSDPLSLRTLSLRFPFVEWGILVSSSAQGGQRFPSREWVERLLGVAGLRTSVHVCGKWCRDICQGDWSGILEDEVFAKLVQQADRIQLNFHSYEHLLTEAFIPGLQANLTDQQQVIFQVDGTNNHLAQQAFDACNVAALFDKSGGAGVVPGDWPTQLEDIYCGYAGGLGPDNVVDELIRIEQVASSTIPIWIDMESKLYHPPGRFSLSHCADVLLRVSSYVCMTEKQ